MARTPGPKSTARGKGQASYQGLGVAPGIAIGPAHVQGSEVPAFADCTIAPDQIELEKTRFAAAVETSKKQLAKLKQKTGNLPAAEAAVTAAILGPLLAPLVPRPCLIDSLCLFGEAADGQFHLVHRYTLSG